MSTQMAFSSVKDSMEDECRLWDSEVKITTAKQNGDSVLKARLAAPKQYISVKVKI